MNLKLEIEFSKADLFKQVDALKKQVDDMRPLPPDVEGRVMQKLRLDWNYNSNAIEGNKLSYGETTALLMHGMTAKGKPLKDHLDIQGHNEAIELLERMVKDERPLTEADIRGLHEVILGKPHTAPAQTADGTPTTKTITVGEYKTLPNHVKTITGEIHYYASPEETPAKMQELMEWYYEVSANKEIHPIVIAALFHHRFVAIHPFDDGNGRMSRILMNLILMRNGYPVAVIKNDNKDEYYSLLSRADVGELFPFVEYIIEKVESSLQLYLKAINGGDIDEDEDIDKEIALFKMEIQSHIDLSEKKSVENINRVFKHEVLPIIESIIEKGKEFEPMFFEIEKAITFYENEILSDRKKHLKKFHIDDSISSKQIDFLCDEIEFGYVFKGFKNQDNVFEVGEFFIVEFFEHSYKVSDFTQSITFSKNYGQLIYTFERNEIVKSFVKSTIAEIKRQIN